MKYVIADNSAVQCSAVCNINFLNSNAWLAGWLPGCKACLLTLVILYLGNFVNTNRTSNKFSINSKALTTIIRQILSLKAHLTCVRNQVYVYPSARSFALQESTNAGRHNYLKSQINFLFKNMIYV
uniref:Uncharacterized protein n=1 Tax=Glossina austeni TaxID=7395 RepID=A0A1A9UX95_GLOAU